MRTGTVAMATPNPMFADLGISEEQRRGAYRESVRVNRPYEDVIERELFGRMTWGNPEGWRGKVAL